MKVYIGPYKEWIGPYRLLKPFSWLIPQKTFDHVVDVMNNWHIFEWIHEWRRRKVKIKLHDYDSWSANHTIALIAAPLLKQLRDHNHGFHFVDDADVIPSLCPSDDHGEARWEFVINEIIYAFERYIDDPEWEYELSRDAVIDEWWRIENGLRLFGKYYRGLWD